MTRDELLERVLERFDERAWDEAAGLLREGLADYPEDPAVHCWLGVAERELGLDGVAYERFKRALSLEPRDAHVLAVAGNGVAAFDDEAAEPALRTAALMAPSLPVARMLYGAFLSRAGMSAEALAELDAARALDEDDPQIAYELGVAHALASNLDAANDAFSDAARLAPDDGWVRVVFGLTLTEAGRPEEGAGELLSGARTSPEDLEAQLAAALAAAATGHDGDAYEMLERARFSAQEQEDVDALLAVEERLDAGPEAAARLLREEVAPGMLRTRLSERP